MSKPLVSICCLAYNHEKYIRECLHGFIKQKTDFAFEILIHDDASTDSTADIIRDYEINYPNIIKPIYQKENQYSQGVGVTREFNFPRAKGKYIAMCEGDDYWTDPLKLQKQVDFLEGNETASGCFHHTSFVDKDGLLIQETYNPIVSKYSFYDQEKCLKFLKSSYATCSLVFRKKVLKDIKDISEKMKSQFCDELLDLVITENGLLYFLDFNGANYRFHNAGIWSGRSKVKFNITLYKRAEALFFTKKMKKKYSCYLKHRLFFLAQEFVFSNAVKKKTRVLYFVKTLRYLNYSKLTSYKFILKFIRKIMKF